jgi:hypothetical protein
MWPSASAEDPGGSSVPLRGGSSVPLRGAVLNGASAVDVANRIVAHDRGALNFFKVSGQVSVAK